VIVRRRIVAVSFLMIVIALGVSIAVLVSAAGGRSPRGRVRETSIAARLSKTHPTLLTLQGREYAAVDSLIERQGFITAGGSERREIALTFDDGPGPYTPLILDQLQRLHVPATFFEIGFMIDYFNDSLRRELRMNMVIGDHTQTHPMMAHLSAAGQQQEILDQTEQLAKYGAPFPHLYRPPYGSFNSMTFRILRHFKMLMVLWTVDTNDYEKPGVETIVHTALAGAKPGAIILMHDAGGNRTETAAALPKIVHALRARGYRLVTVPQLVLDDPPPPGQPLPTNLAGG
jgi:peptidoglycan-N-acetylglucosamine deacetylase